MKKITISIVLTSLVLLAISCVVGNVITVADKVSELSPLLGYAFYAILLTLTAVFVVWPTFKIIFTPELEPSGELMDEDDRNEAASMVRKSARKVFMLTSVSPNGAFDVFICLGMTISLINRLIEKRGKRPSLGQILKLYVAVVSSSVLISSADEVLGEMDFGELLGMSGVNITGTVLKSAANGMINAFVTLRVGMTAQKYLEEGSVYFNENKQAIRKEIRRRAVKCMPLIVAGGVKNGILGLRKIF